MPRSRVSVVVRWTIFVILLVAMNMAAAAWAYMSRADLLGVPRFQWTNGISFAGLQFPTWWDYLPGLG